MTAEQIALKHGLCHCDKYYKRKGIPDPLCPWHGFAVKDAMEEYAMQQWMDGYNKGKLDGRLNPNSNL